MTFSTPDWWELSDAQRTTLTKLRNDKRAAAGTTVSSGPATTLSVNSTQQIVPAMSTTDQEDLATGQNVRKILSTQASSFWNAALTGARSINMA